MDVLGLNVVNPHTAVFRTFSGTTGYQVVNLHGLAQRNFTLCSLCLVVTDKEPDKQKIFQNISPQRNC